ncbi:hypothetical protein GYM38_001458 [Escherichia coli]|nr:hypothetical protein [Escherichia coli]EFI4016452.1 hypothetical protein [Escherichia coli]
MLTGLFFICLLMFMPETDSLKHPQRFYLPSPLVHSILQLYFLFVVYIVNNM